MTILKNIFFIFLKLIIFIKILNLYYHESWELKKKKIEKQLNNVERTWVPQRRFIELDDDKS